MNASRGPLWTLDELSAKVALALAVGYAGQANGRVRDVPDVRTIRYYTTLGLLDRPAAFRGRTALYGPRHLMQLVAVKRLQAHGLTLAQVQERLLGLPPAKLRELARLPAGLETDDAPPPPAPEPDAPREPFWKAAPAPVPPAAPAALVGVPLAAGVTLLLEARRDLDDHDLEALRAAAAPLLKLLTARRVVGPADPPTRTKGDAP